jgi:ribosome-associated translation inhibitor RaiA
LLFAVQTAAATRRWRGRGLPAALARIMLYQRAMAIPLQITFRGMEHSAAIESVITQRAARLERFSERIKHCHVLVDIPHRSHHKGNHYTVRIDIRTLAGEIAVTRDPLLDGSHEDLRAVLRDAFDIAARRLDDDQRQRSEHRPTTDGSLRASKADTAR